MTIMELMIVIALISFAGGVLAVNANRLVRKERFNNEVKALHGKIETAMALNKLFNIESKMEFAGAKEHIEFLMAIDVAGKPGWIKNLEKQQGLRAIHFLEFDDFTGSQQEGSMKFNFFANGGLPKGVLRISTSRHESDTGALSCYFAFSGLSTEVKMFKDKEDAKINVLDDGEQKDMLLTRYLIDEVTALHVSKISQDSNN